MENKTTAADGPALTSLHKLADQVWGINQGCLKDDPEDVCRVAVVLVGVLRGEDMLTWKGRTGG